MSVALALFYAILLAFLDRLGGGGFAFLGPWVPNLLRRGHKVARRFGIPAALFFLLPSWTGLASCVLLAVIFSFNLDEIEERRWEEMFLWSAVFFYALLPFCGLWGLIPAVWWLLGIILSNYGIAGRKLPWHYVEALRGAFIALGAFLYGTI